MGANGPKKQERCWRGHELSPSNVLPASGGGRRCRACNRASSTAHNHRVRWNGRLLSAAEMTALADKKYFELMGAHK